MRRKRNFRSFTPETSALAHAAKARKKVLHPVDRIGRPKIGRLLHTIRVENHVAGLCFEIRVCQAKRLNQVIVESPAGRSNPHGMDWVVNHLRKRLVIRWLKEL